MLGIYLLCHLFSDCDPHWDYSAQASIEALFNPKQQNDQASKLSCRSLIKCVAGNTVWVEEVTICQALESVPGRWAPLAHASKLLLDKDLAVEDVSHLDKLEVLFTNAGLEIAATSVMPNHESLEESVEEQPVIKMDQFKEGENADVVVTEVYDVSSFFVRKTLHHPGLKALDNEIAHFVKTEQPRQQLSFQPEIGDMCLAEMKIKQTGETKRKKIYGRARVLAVQSSEPTGEQEAENAGIDATASFEDDEPHLDVKTYHVFFVDEGARNTFNVPMYLLF